MVEGTIEDPMIPAPAILRAPGQQIHVALDTFRFRNTMLFTPVVSLIYAAYSQGRKLRQLPIHSVPVYSQPDEHE
jgi:hypothetical protein